MLILLTQIILSLSRNYIVTRFERKKFIDFEHFVSIRTPTSENIRDIMDRSDETIRILKGIGKEEERRNPWLLIILTGKLDDESKSLWTQETA